MFRFLSVAVAGFIVSASVAEAQSRSRSSGPRTKQATAPRTNAARNLENAMSRALSLAKAGNYQEASRLLFQLSQQKDMAPRLSQIEYILGQMMTNMKLDQTAAWFFVKVIRRDGQRAPSSAPVRGSLRLLAEAADRLESDVLIRYAISQIKEEDFPAASRDMLVFRNAELKVDEKQFVEAARLFSRIPRGSLFYYRAQYRMGLAWAEAGQHDQAISAFERLASQAVDGGVTDRNRVNALMGKARVLYQRQDWDGAIAAYRAIPRDTDQWHDSLFEGAWAMLRAGQFRSAISNFHSLHSVYYEDFYQPESIYLRGLVYLYICRFDELEKTVDTFNRVYRGVARDVRNFLQAGPNDLAIFREIARVRNGFDQLKRNKAARKGLQLPFLATRQVLKEGDVKRLFGYLARIEDEKKRLESQPPSWVNSGLGREARSFLDRRIQATRSDLGRLTKGHLRKMLAEIDDIRQQVAFLEVEVARGRTESKKQELAGKVLDRRVDQQSERNFYVQNGYEYWPFVGEYWLDEIGNYQYVGVRACD